MGDLLLVCPDVAVSSQVGELAQKFGFRVKEVADTSIAIEWLRMRNFDGLLVPDVLLSRAQPEISDLLWRRNPLAALITLVPTDKLDSSDPKFDAAEVVRLAHIELDLTPLLRNLNSSAAAAPSLFKVMIVEDLDAPRDIICAFVESLKIASVEGFSSAGEALAQLEAHPLDYACVLTDLKMPEISGQQFIQQLRLNSRTKHIPIVALTAHGTADSLIACIKAGATGFLVKPPKRAELLRELSRALRISVLGLSPILASPQEADRLHIALAERGIL